MPPQEADDFSDAGLKPYKVPGEPSEQTKPIVVSLEELEETPEKTEEVAEKAADKTAKFLENQSAKIQAQSEQLYELFSFRAKTEEGTLDKLLAGDTMEKKMAKKIIERNSSHFGAKTIEEYVIKREKEKAGSDPTAQKLAELTAKQQLLEERDSKRDWETWKKENAVAGSVAKAADELHSTYPDLPFGIVIATAKGLADPQTLSQKETVATAAGSVSAPASEEPYVPQSAMGKAFLRSIDMKKLKKFAKEYYS